MVSVEVVQATKRELVRRHLEERIQQLKPHEKLPAERELAETLAVNRLTIRRALDDLDRDGLVYRVQGSGTFVSAGQISKSFEFTSFSEDMRARDMRPGSLSVTITVEPAGMKVGYALGLSPATPVVHIRRVRTANDAPMCLEDSCLPEALVPGLADGIRGDSLYEDLAHRFGIHVERADQTIQATVLGETEANQLAVPAFSPAFLVQRTGLDSRGRSVEYAESLYRGDRYSYTVSITRSHHQEES
jgi:GntR family transcriptional regulator